MSRFLEAYRIVRDVIPLMHKVQKMGIDYRAFDDGIGISPAIDAEREKIYEKIEALWSRVSDGREPKNVRDYIGIPFRHPLIICGAAAGVFRHPVKTCNVLSHPAIDPEYDNNASGEQ